MNEFKDPLKLVGMYKMGIIGKCAGQCTSWKGIGRHMDWEINVYCSLCRKIFARDLMVDNRFCPCCKGWARRSASTSATNKRIKRKKMRMNALRKRRNRLQKVSQ